MSNAGNENGLQRLEVIRKLNGENREWVNSELYRLMYKQDLYILAYERIKSHPGNMTPGTDDETQDGFSLAMIDELIQEMRTERYHCKPVRTAYIPKSNGKMRKLGIPCTRDKIVQEVVRLILEAIYDSPQGAYFSANSHGFRRSKSCHSALKDIQARWSGVSWFLEGDIKPVLTTSIMKYCSISSERKSKMNGSYRSSESFSRRVIKTSMKLERTR
jgi:retron-type reverse transcriptase